MPTDNLPATPAAESPRKTPAPLPHWANEVVVKHVKGLSFADVGGLWGTLNERVSVALNAGARSAAMIDIQPQSHALWDKFDARCKEQEVLGYEKITRDLNTINQNGVELEYDFVHCSGIIYHVPNPIFTIERLRSMTRKYLIVGSIVFPERITTEIGSLSLEEGAVYFIPALSDRVKAILSAHLDRVGVKAQNINTAMAPWWAVSGAQYGPWWWAWSAQTLGRMIECAGLRILEDGAMWGGHSHLFFCEKA